MTDEQKTERYLIISHIDPNKVGICQDSIWHYLTDDSANSIVNMAKSFCIHKDKALLVDQLNTLLPEDKQLIGPMTRVMLAGDFRSEKR